MSVQSTLGHDEPFVVSPARARAMLDVGNTRLYELIEAGELESYRDGKHRKVTVASIKARIARKLAEASSSGTSRHCQRPRSAKRPL